MAFNQKVSHVLFMRPGDTSRDIEPDLPNQVDWLVAIPYNQIINCVINLLMACALCSHCMDRCDTCTISQTVWMRGDAGSGLSTLNVNA